MLTENQVERLARLVRLAPWMTAEQVEGLAKLIRDLKIAESAGAMPTSVIEDLAKAVPDKVCSEIVRDLRGFGRAEPGGFLGPTKSEKREPARAKHIPLEPPPGISIMDEMMDQQDRIDRAERIKGFGSALLGGPRIVRKGDV